MAVAAVLYAIHPNDFVAKFFEAFLGSRPTRLQPRNTFAAATVDW
jgi:hypothetical protein